MRAIKFRIYFEDEEPFMSEPITLEDLLHGEDIEFRNEDDTLSLPLNDFRFFYKRNQNYKIMQYTGLHDKNGKEIYEGDIIKSYYYIDTPDGEKERYNQKVINYNEVLCEYNIDAFENLEVIGNIYNNQDLLERSSNGDIEKE